MTHDGELPVTAGPLEQDGTWSQGAEPTTDRSAPPTDTPSAPVHQPGPTAPVRPVPCQAAPGRVVNKPGRNEPSLNEPSLNEPGRKELRDCFSCLALLVFGLLLVYVVGTLSFTPPGE